MAGLRWPKGTVYGKNRLRFLPGIGGWEVVLKGSFISLGHLSRDGKLELQAYWAARVRSGERLPAEWLEDLEEFMPGASDGLEGEAP